MTETPTGASTRARTALVATDTPGRWAKQLASHLGRPGRMGVEETAQGPRLTMTFDGVEAACLELQRRHPEADEEHHQDRRQPSEQVGVADRDLNLEARGVKGLKMWDLVSLLHRGEDRNRRRAFADREDSRHDRDAPFGRQCLGAVAKNRRHAQA